MAKKKAEPVVSISRADLKKLPRNEQRRLLDLGYVQGESAPAGGAVKK